MTSSNNTNLIEFDFPPISKQPQMQREDGHQITVGNKCDIMLFGGINHMSLTG